MQLNPSEISELIRAKIQNLPSSTEVRTRASWCMPPMYGLSSAAERSL